MKLPITLFACLMSFPLFAQFTTPFGTPGPHYWQNRTDYTINASLDTNLHLITGRVAITYHNNSPYALDYLWLQLEQNKYRADSRGAMVNNGGNRHEGSMPGWMRAL